MIPERTSRAKRRETAAWVVSGAEGREPVP